MYPEEFILRAGWLARSGSLTGFSVVQWRVDIPAVMVEAVTTSPEPSFSSVIDPSSIRYEARPCDFLALP